MDSAHVTRATWVDKVIVVMVYNMISLYSVSAVLNILNLSTCINFAIQGSHFLVHLGEFRRVLHFFSVSFLISRIK